MRWDCMDILLASHQGEPGSIPGRVTPPFSQVGIVPYDAAGRRVFSGSTVSSALSFRRCFILTSFHAHRLSRPLMLRAPQISQLNSTQSTVNYFLGASRFSRSFIPVLLNTHLIHPQRPSDFVFKSRPNLFTHSLTHSTSRIVASTLGTRVRRVYHGNRRGRRPKDTRKFRRMFAAVARALTAPPSSGSHEMFSFSRTPLCSICTALVPCRINAQRIAMKLCAEVDIVIIYTMRTNRLRLFQRRRLREKIQIDITVCEVCRCKFASSPKAAYYGSFVPEAVLRVRGSQVSERYGRHSTRTPGTTSPLRERHRTGSQRFRDSRESRNEAVTRPIRRREGDGRGLIGTSPALSWSDFGKPAEKSKSVWPACESSKGIFHCASSISIKNDLFLFVSLSRIAASRYKCPAVQARKTICQTILVRGAEDGMLRELCPFARVSVPHLFVPKTKSTVGTSSLTGTMCVMRRAEGEIRHALVICFLPFLPLSFVEHAPCLGQLHKRIFSRAVITLTPCAWPLIQHICKVGNDLRYDKIDVKHVYTEVEFAIGSQFIRHALDDSEPIAYLQGNKSVHRVRKDPGSIPDTVHPEFGFLMFCRQRLMRLLADSFPDPACLSHWLRVR
ncbi:hypothetical protein PR048_013912 [Dryococelus australis]|uniref:Uncharacterized protein n=1 Tax=Dryococelus australis TaxID=614101 RepID=A0ABQ9HUF5_9NEOP|nr:hypothetical protein PR048_013912 [Dryococelus australis]